MADVIAEIGADDVLLILPGSTDAPWQSESARQSVRKLPAAAISVADHLPPMREEVLGWLSAPGVAIYFMPAIVWRTPTNTPSYDEWWSGLPGTYIDLRRHKWRLSHWLPLDRAAGGAEHG